MGGAGGAGRGGWELEGAGFALRVGGAGFELRAGRGGRGWGRGGPEGAGRNLALLSLVWKWRGCGEGHSAPLGFLGSGLYRGRGRGSLGEGKPRGSLGEGKPRGSLGEGII